MYLYILYVKIHIFFNSEIVVIESNICIYINIKYNRYHINNVRIHYENK